MIYLAEVILYTGAMILVYLLFLRNRPLYLPGRVYLLLCSLLPLLLPLVSVPVAWQQSVQKISALQFTLPEVVIPVVSQHQMHHGIAAYGGYIVYGLVSLCLFT